MKRTCFRLLALFISMLVLFTMMPPFMPIAFAEDSTPNPTNDGYYWTKDASGVTIDGYAGTDMNVLVPTEIDGASVIKIGSGAFSGQTTIRSVTVPEGVTEIGDYAFNGCERLASVTLPASLTTIGDDVFGSCGSLVILDLCEDNTSFCIDAFGVLYNTGKTRLIVSPPVNTRTSYAVPETVTVIDPSAFSLNAALESIMIPDTVVNIGGGAFKNCPNLTGLSFPSGLLEIKDSMCAGCAALSSVTLPARLQTIGSLAFYSCENLTDVTLPTSLENIGNSAFGMCGLTSVTIPASAVNVDDMAFMCCRDIAQFSVGTGNTAFESRDGVLFRIRNASGDSMLGLLQYPSAKADTSYTIPDGTTYLYGNCFDECKYLETVDIPASVGFADPNNPTCGTAEDFYAFRKCEKLSHFNTSGTGNNFVEYGGALYSNDKQYLFYYPMTKTDTTFELPAEVNNIRCDFSYAKTIETFTVAEGNTSYYAMDGILYDKKGLYPIDPEADKWIAMIAYPLAKIVETLTIPAKVANPVNPEDDPVNLGIEMLALNNNEHIKHVIYEPGNIGVGTCQFANCVNLETVEMPEGIQRIGNSVFYNCPKLKSITIPASVESIEEFAFEGCTGLETITFAGASSASPALRTAAKTSASGTSLTEIKNGVFAGCTSLLSIDIPDSVNTIGDSAFTGCDSLSAINIGSGNAVYSSQAGVLYDKAGTVLLQYPMNRAGPNFTVPASVALINAGAFAGCVNLTKITIPSTVTSIDTFAFSPDARSRITIYGTPASFAETYAHRLGIAFQALASTCTVSFDSQGGSEVSSQTVETNSKATAPAAPTFPHHQFGGWYKEAACINAWSFTSDSVTGDITLYAKWTLDTHTVTYDCQGGSTVAPVTAVYGATISAPAAPINQGHSFGGWFRDAACTSAWRFGSDTVTADITLYAKWSVNTYTVTFNAQGGSEVASKSTQYNTTVAEPATPYKEGCTFGGWYREAGCANAWSFSSDKVTGDITLFARWVQNPPAATLSGILLSAGSLSPAFSPTVGKYTITLNETDAGTTVTPLKTYAGATMTINGKKITAKYIPVANGKSVTLSIRVINGKKAKTYTLTVRRPKSTNNALQSLKVSAGTLSPAFNPTITSYELTLPEGTASVTVTAMKASPLATISGAKRTYKLNNGQTVYHKITVRSQSGKTKTYTLKITRDKSTNANLSYLRTNTRKYPLEPRFNAHTRQYTVTLPKNVSSVTLNWKASGYKASAKVDGRTLSSKRVKLQSSQNVTVNIVVTSQAGNAETYTVIITRE